MKAPGFLRRVALLAIGCYLYSHLVLRDDALVPNPLHREWLTWLMYALVAWAVITLLADRAKRKESQDD